MDKRITINSSLFHSSEIDIIGDGDPLVTINNSNFSDSIYILLDCYEANLINLFFEGIVMHTSIHNLINISVYNNFTFKDVFILNSKLIN